MIASMTAFARAEKTLPELRVSVEVKSVNHRFCEVVVRLPRAYLPLEEEVKRAVREHVARGRVDVYVDVVSTAEAARTFEVDESLAAAYAQALEKLKQALGITEDVPLALVARQEGVVTPVSRQPDLDREWPQIREVLAEALDVFAAMRRTEGAALERDFRLRIEELAGLLEKISAHADEVPRRVHEKYAQRISALAGEAADPARVVQEAALLADKADITEEIVRAKSHLSQFAQLMEGGEPAGRSLNFLAQELLREFSTMGAKSVDPDLSHLVVSAKTEVEKLREQIANVE
ncbi:MAG: YicC family protein [Deltaproteobacteria bacterium]|nr:YicC family protein [Deltaproteobacteria bacterium]